MKTILHFHLIAISSILLSVDSCNNKKESTTTSPTTYSQPQTTTTSSSTTTATPTPTPTVTPAPPKDENVRFVVSFYSIGQGIDSKTNDEFVKFLDTYPNPKKINYTPSHWGREGEVYYCLALKELTPIEQEEFIRKAKKILSTNVNASENSACSHKKSGAADEKYRLIISFTSIGEGINTDVKEKFEKFATTFSPKVNFETVKWGREGETDYCFNLKELSTLQQEEFVRKSKEIATKKVNLKENEKCTH